MKQLLVPVAVIVAIASSASLAWTAGRKAPPAPVIAIVDVSKVFNSLNEQKVRLDQFQARGQELDKSLKDLEAKLKSEKSAYDILPDGAEKQAKRQTLQRLIWQFEIETKLAQKTLDDTEAEMVRALYLKIDDAAGKVAKASGYTMVLSSDEAGQIPEQNVTDITRAITNKRMLYIDPAHDITAELIAFMNNEFGAAPAPAAPAGNR